MNQAPRSSRETSSKLALDVLPLKPADFQILLVLVDETLHPYGLMKKVEEQSAGKVRLELGSLYRVIDRLLREELIARVDDETENGRRREYSITPFGIEVAKAEALRLTELVDLARKSRLLGDLHRGNKGRA